MSAAMRRKGWGPQRLPWAPALLLAGALLAGCGAPEHGPVRVRWDRDTCERCQMTISDPRFAAEVRVHAGDRVHKFDDLGCALAWLEEQGGASPPPPAEFWVRDLDGKTWLDATRATYQAGQKSPMGYGFGARASQESDAMSFTAVQQRLREVERERRRPQPAR